jgi:hypothetical protein
MIYYRSPLKVEFPVRNSTFYDCKVFQESGTAVTVYVRIGLAPWIRISIEAKNWIRICIEAKSWIRICIEAKCGCTTPEKHSFPEFFRNHHVWIAFFCFSSFSGPVSILLENVNSDPPR